MINIGDHGGSFGKGGRSHDIKKYGLINYGSQSLRQATYGNFLDGPICAYSKDEVILVAYNNDSNTLRIEVSRYNFETNALNYVTTIHMNIKPLEALYDKNTNFLYVLLENKLIGVDLNVNAVVWEDSNKSYLDSIKMYNGEVYVFRGNYNYIGVYGPAGFNRSFPMTYKTIANPTGIQYSESFDIDPSNGDMYYIKALDGVNGAVKKRTQSGTETTLTAITNGPLTGTLLNSVKFKNGRVILGFNTNADNSTPTKEVAILDTSGTVITSFEITDMGGIPSEVYALSGVFLGRRYICVIRPDDFYIRPIYEIWDYNGNKIGRYVWEDTFEGRPRGRICELYDGSGFAYVSKQALSYDYMLGIKKFNL
jgi:hypothetical protein